MNLLPLIFGALLLIPAIYMVLLLLFWALFEVLSRNLHEYLIIPALIASTGGGVWLLGHGLGAW